MHQTRGHRFAAAWAVTTLTVLGVAACDSADDEDPASSAPPAAALAWGPCPAAAPGTARDPRVTCAKVKVPLDYGRPDGKPVEVVISKLAATDPAKRHGVLVLNPGGPALPKSVLDGYDLIGFDARGVGTSTPQSCGLDSSSAPPADGFTGTDPYVSSRVKQKRPASGARLGSRADERGVAQLTA
ncbi:hypothetical protein ACIRSS_04325 [Amycolatopsis sp. NPDC101161]|uniref:hypothetical protein n=1 Tax=Amycolatopsis sp. NPDC101161 TaxID=3363940 RepID=UPI00381ED1C5